jgi:hypothetical protein
MFLVIGADPDDGVLEVPGIVPSWVRVPALPLNLVLQFVVVEARGSQFLHFPLVLSIEHLSFSFIGFYFNADATPSSIPLQTLVELTEICMRILAALIR